MSFNNVIGLNFQFQFSTGIGKFNIFRSRVNLNKNREKYSI